MSATSCAYLLLALLVCLSLIPFSQAVYSIVKTFNCGGKYCEVDQNSDKIILCGADAAHTHLISQRSSYIKSETVECHNNRVFWQIDDGFQALYSNLPTGTDHTYAEVSQTVTLASQWLESFTYENAAGTGAVWWKFKSDITLGDKIDRYYSNRYAGGAGTRRILTQDAKSCWSGCGASYLHNVQVGQGGRNNRIVWKYEQDSWTIIGGSGSPTAHRYYYNCLQGSGSGYVAEYTAITGSANGNTEYICAFSISGDTASWKVCTNSGCSTGCGAIQTATMQPCEALTTNTLSLTKTPAAGGTVTGTGISCGTSCSFTSADYASTDSVTLTRTISSGYTFVGWSGDCTGTAATCTVSMNVPRSVTATYAILIFGICQPPEVFDLGEAFPGTFIPCASGTPDRILLNQLGAAGGSTFSWICQGSDASHDSGLCIATRATVAGYFNNGSAVADTSDFPVNYTDQSSQDTTWLFGYTPLTPCEEVTFNPTLDSLGNVLFSHGTVRHLSNLTLSTTPTGFCGVKTFALSASVMEIGLYNITGPQRGNTGITVRFPEIPAIIYPTNIYSSNLNDAATAYDSAGVAVGSLLLAYPGYPTPTFIKFIQARAQLQAAKLYQDSCNNNGEAACQLSQYYSNQAKLLANEAADFS